MHRHLLFLLPALLAGCTVYAPMQPTLPQVRAKGETDLAASLQPTGRLEATAAYSPLPHVVVLGSLTGAPRLGEQVFLTTAQYEVGAGFYQPLGSWLVGAQVGGGQAYVHRRYEQLFGGYRESEASYGKLFGQAGVAYQGIFRSLSLTYRLTRVQFGYVRDADFGPLPLREMLRHEVALGSRVALSGSRRWQLVGTGGVSVATDSQPDGYSYSVSSRIHNQLGPAFFLSLGVAYRPGRFW